VQGVPQADGSLLSLANAAWIWVPLLLIATVAAGIGMNDIASSKASIAPTTGPQAFSFVVIKSAVSRHLRFIYRFFSGLCHAGENTVPDVNILQLAFFGPFIGALARSAGGVSLTSWWCACHLN
jgi:NNP family nitrate/nitrite transporter-like MFS transporter